MFANPCVYAHGGNEIFTTLSLHVDDILVTGRSKEVVQQFKKALKNRFAMKDMGEVRLIPGITVTRDCNQGALIIKQKKHGKDILERFGMLDSRQHTHSRLRVGAV